MSQFKLGDFIIDTERCQIQRNDDTTSIEPKVMDTLGYLAKHPGRVISQKELFSAVWPEAIYNPSSIQRCIALLRKALKEDAKNSKAIITHPKRGYSLELPVESLGNNNLSFNEIVKGNKLAHRFFQLISLAIVIFTTYLIFNLNTEVSIKEQYSELIPVVSTGKNELYSQFSPDGQYLAYIAQAKDEDEDEDEDYHIWVKNLETSKVFKLSDSASKFVSISWTNDQQAISFVERLSDGDQIGRLPFNRYQSEPVEDQILLSLKNERIFSQLQWTKNGDVIFVAQDKNHRTRLLRYEVESIFKTQLLAEEDVKGIFDIALSNDNKTLALISTGKPNHNPIRLFDLETSQLKLLMEITGNVNGINWHPSDASLLISNRTKLRSVDLSGNITDLKFSNYLNITNANYSPDGNKITMTLVDMDFDILVSSLNNSGMKQTIVDSNSIDMQPAFSPDSSQFSFVSLRSGNQQVYIYKDGVERLIFNNSGNEEFFGMAWSPDGQNLAVSMQDNLYVISVDDGEIKRSIKHRSSSMYLRDWYHNENALLVNLPGFIIAKFDLDSLNLTQLTDRTSSGIELDLGDNLYIDQISEVVKLTNNGEESIFWQTKEGEIYYLFVSDNELMIELDTQQTKQLVKIDFDKRSPVKYSKLDIGKGWLIDVSSDGTKLLSMTRSSVNRTIFTLQ